MGHKPTASGLFSRMMRLTGFAAFIVAAIATPLRAQIGEAEVTDEAAIAVETPPVRSSTLHLLPVVVEIISSATGEVLDDERADTSEIAARIASLLQEEFSNRGSPLEQTAPTVPAAAEESYSPAALFRELRGFRPNAYRAPSQAVTAFAEAAPMRRALAVRVRFYVGYSSWQGPVEEGFFAYFWTGQAAVKRAVFESYIYDLEEKAELRVVKTQSRINPRAKEKAFRKAINEWGEAYFGSAAPDGSK